MDEAHIKETTLMDSI